MVEEEEEDGDDDVVLLVLTCLFDPAERHAGRCILRPLSVGVRGASFATAARCDRISKVHTLRVSGKGETKKQFCGKQPNGLLFPFFNGRNGGAGLCVCERDSLFSLSLSRRITAARCSRGGLKRQAACIKSNLHNRAIVWRLFVLCGSNEQEGAREDKAGERASERGNLLFVARKGGTVPSLVWKKRNIEN